MEDDMSGFSRRSFLAAGAATAMVTASPAFAAEMRRLRAGERAGGMSLMEALKLRRSIRIYSDEPIAAETLADLLWAAYGINRPDSGGRTAPSWHTSYGGDLYVAAADGVWLYDPKEESLTQIVATDIRKKASPQPFVGTAPIVILHVTDLDRMYEAPDETRIQNAHVDAAIVAQNIYLFCASAGLGTCLVGGADRAAVAEALSLSDRKIVTFVQPVGHPQAT
jgi:SagB-type dehydrogenase family enzyme